VRNERARLAGESWSRWTAIGVPVDSVGRAGGTEHAPAAMRERGLLEWIGARDGGDLDVKIHGDGRDPETGIVGAADLLAMTGAVRAAVRDVDAAGGASAEPERVVVLGARDPEEAADIAPLLAGELAALAIHGPAALRAAGLRASGEAAAARLERFWIHLDVDVLDEQATPATDYLMPGGLEWAELAELLAPLGAAPGLAGFSLACVNPEKDPGGRWTDRTAELLAGALG